MAARPSITISIPPSLLARAGSLESQSSTTANLSEEDHVSRVEETELHKLLYSLARLGLSQHEDAVNLPAHLFTEPPRTTDSTPQRGSLFSASASVASPSAGTRPLRDDSFDVLTTQSAPASPAYRPSAMWMHPTSPTATTTSDRSVSFAGSQISEAPSSTSSRPASSGVASLAFRSIMQREDRRTSRRRSTKKQHTMSAPSSPTRGPVDVGSEDAGYGSDGGGYSSPPPLHSSRGSVTFLTMKNLLRGGGALARTVRREMPERRPTCMGTISSRLKRRQKFHRPTVITDAYHRVYVSLIFSR
ncbi:hypothetical protein PINS_up021007 [Pythium insidiosum]|nr:hypothetical protein PINS_up021007 [Pythium insidiosum]